MTIDNVLIIDSIYIILNTKLNNITNNGNFDIVIILVVVDWDNRQCCLYACSLDAAMTTINVSGCTLNAVTSSEATGVYTYELPKADYETCSDSVTGTTGIITYTSAITLTVSSGECYWFRENDNTQQMNIAVDVSNIGAGTNVTDAADVAVQVVDYDLEQCLPAISYGLVPQHRAIFYVNYTFAGDSLVLDPLKTPQLDDAGNTLSIVSSSCTTHSSGNGNECMYVFKSTECRRSYLTSDEQNCVVDRFNDNILKEMGVVVTTGATDVTHNFDVINTALENKLFPSSYCDAFGNINATNVTDTYTASLSVRNLPGPDWDAEPDFIAFYDQLILQMVVDEGGTLTSSDFQIQTVTVTIRDPSDDEIIAQKTFSKGDKEILHPFDWTGYYDDAHFCSYHYPNNTCPVFYEVGSERINGYFPTLSPLLPSVCQTAIDNSTTDYFTFNPDNWFTSPQIPEVKIQFNLIATINLCDGSGRRRLQEEIVNIEFIELNLGESGVRTLLYVDPTDAPTTATPTTTAAPTTAAPIDDDSNDLAIILGATGGGLAVSICCVWFLLSKRRKKRDGDKYDRV